MKKTTYIIYITLSIFLFSACSEDNSIRMPDFEVGIVATADIEANRYWFNADDLPNTLVAFDLAYDGFDVHTAESIELFISKGSDIATVGTFTNFPAAISITATEAYGFFNETINDYDADGSGGDEFQFTYRITTMDGQVFSQYGQYYAYNPSLDGRFTGRYAQFSTNLPGFGVLIFDVRPPNPGHPNEN